MENIEADKTFLLILPSISQNFMSLPQNFDLQTQTRTEKVSG